MMSTLSASGVNQSCFADWSTLYGANVQLRRRREQRDDVADDEQGTHGVCLVQLRRRSSRSALAGRIQPIRARQVGDGTPRKRIPAVLPKKSTVELTAGMLPSRLMLVKLTP